MHVKLTGVLYLHPEESDLSSKQLKQNLGALKALLGDYWLPCVKIAVVPSPAEREASSDVVNSLQEPTSPFYDLHVGGAEIRSLTLQTQAIRQVLLDYNTQPPQAPSFYARFRNGRPRGLEAYVEEQLGLPKVDMSSSQPHHARSRGRGGRGQNNSTRSAPEESARGIQQLELALVEVENEKSSIRDQLQQTHFEYASLRSELQLHDNMEQHMIVQSLKDLNRQIGSLGRSVAASLVDSYAETRSSNITTLQTANFSDLKAQFGHTDGISSLVLSSTGEGVPIEDFLDFALRSIFCQRLYENIFLPFHPELANSPNDEFMASLYREVRIQGKSARTVYAFK